MSGTAKVWEHHGQPADGRRLPWVRELAAARQTGDAFSVVLVFDSQRRRDFVRRRLTEQDVSARVLKPRAQPDGSDEDRRLSDRLLFLSCPGGDGAIESCPGGGDCRGGQSPVRELLLTRQRQAEKGNLLPDPSGAAHKRSQSPFPQSHRNARSRASTTTGRTSSPPSPRAFGATAIGRGLGIRDWGFEVRVSVLAAVPIPVAS